MLGDWTSLDKTGSQGEEEGRVGELHGSWIELIERLLFGPE